MFYLVDKTEDLSLGHNISNNSDCYWKGGESGYIENLQQRAGSLKSKVIDNKENQIAQVKEFSAFSMHETIEEPGLTEIIPLICTSPIGASILCFHNLSSLRAH